TLYGKKGYDLINREAKFLDQIFDLISLRIPKPIYVSSDPENPFVGYEKIDGISLSRCFSKIAKEGQINIAKQLGMFLSELHSPGIYQRASTIWKRARDFSSDLFRSEWQNRFDKIQDIAYPLLNSDQKSWVTRLFQEFLNEKDNFDFNPVVVHGDFDTSNILVNPTTCQVTGIIDFEESNIYDPAVDFLFYELDDSFLEHVLASYNGFKDAYFKRRMRFYYCRSGLIYITYGLENDLEPMVDYGLQLLDKRMKVFHK
ncbi:MAG: phosphotransferase family protein, partial [Candidatus Odinarchaeota archaeon]